MLPYLKNIIIIIIIHLENTIDKRGRKCIVMETNVTFLWWPAFPYKTANSNHTCFSVHLFNLVEVNGNSTVILWWIPLKRASLLVNIRDLQRSLRFAGFICKKFIVRLKNKTKSYIAIWTSDFLICMLICFFDFLISDSA